MYSGVRGTDLPLSLRRRPDGNEVDFIEPIKYSIGSENTAVKAFLSNYIITDIIIQVIV